MAVRNRGFCRSKIPCTAKKNQKHIKVARLRRGGQIEIIKEKKEG